MPFHKVIGIDLGTTYSAVAAWDGREIQMIDSALGARTVPSVVALDPAGQVIVGAPAQNALTFAGGDAIIEVKREMGEYDRPPTGDDPGRPRLIRFRDYDYSPQEISAFILMELKRQAENSLGEPIHDAVVTVPAYFKEPQRGATMDAAMMARLNVRRLLNEPTAAAICFGADKVEDDRAHRYLVYDLGGGTFDVSIVEVRPDNVSVVGTGGDARLGGGDFDDLIVEYALEEIRKEHRVDLGHDPVVRQRIKREAEMRKRELSVATATMLNLPYLTGSVSAHVNLTRATFESLIKGLLDRSLRCLDEALDSAYEKYSLEREQIEQVLLVGGSSRIACIRPMLAEHLGLELKDIRGDINPDEVVARGAAIVAREFEPSGSYLGPDRPAPTSPGRGTLDTGGPDNGGIDLQDVTSHTLGVLANRADFIPILPKDSRIPIEETQDNFINGDKSASLEVLIFQGEQSVAFDNTLIGKVPIQLPEARERGYWRFAIRFALDENGLLAVEVKCLNDGQIWRTDLECAVRARGDQLANRGRELRSVMAGAEPPDQPPPPALPPLPPPPRRDEPAAPATLPPVPAQTPPDHHRIAQRSYEAFPQLSPSQQDELRPAYLAFVEAVLAGSDDLVSLGDALEDTFHRVRRPA
jgi:molecular chaperone DnaK